MIGRTLFILFLITACTKHQEKPGDDYVLIEFASKLEEDYQKLDLKPSDKKIIQKD